MGRSLYRMLRRRFGTRLSGAERIRRAQEHYERVRTAMPLEIFKSSPPAGTSPGSVAVIGAGFAGCAAAYVANFHDFQVTVYDPAGVPGGRVTSSPSVVPGRILETGAELIGLNHPAWTLIAASAGFALGVVTPDDDYTGAFLTTPFIMNGVSYNSFAQEQLYTEMQNVFSGWLTTAENVTMPWTPWLTPNAAALDAQNLGAQIPAGTPADAAEAIAMEFEFNNTTPIGEQSWLANLAQFQGGGGQDFFDDTEVFRCTAGNQSLAYWLLGSIPLIPLAVTAIDTSNGVTLTFQDGGEAGPFDYCIVATPVAIWPRITVDNNPFPFAGIANGPAIKYLAPVGQRFWIPELLAPSGMLDTLGMTWEGTDNQADTAGFDLSVFSGGQAAQDAINNGGTDQYFQPLLGQLYPGFSTSGGTFSNPSGDLNIQMGYSCPGPNQVVGVQQTYATPYNGRLFVAGEHTSPVWFGFMEGALESGIVAAERLGQVAGVDHRPEWGGTEAL